MISVGLAPAGSQLASYYKNLECHSLTLKPA